MRRGNGHVEARGGAVTLTTRAEDMAAYDALPAVIRAAIAEAPVNWSASNILDRWQRALMIYGERRATAAAVRVLREAAAAPAP